MASPRSSGCSPPFREGLGTAEAVSAALGISLIELDHAVDASIKRRFGAAGRALGGRQRPPGAPAPAPDELAAEAAASPNDFLAQLRAGIAFFEAERDEEASAWLKRAAEIIPEYGGVQTVRSAFWAAIHERRGRQEEARRGAGSSTLLRFPAAYDDWLASRRDAGRRGESRRGCPRAGRSDRGVSHGCRTPRTTGPELPPPRA